MSRRTKKIGDLAVADQFFPNALAARFRLVVPFSGTKTSTAATTASFCPRCGNFPEKRVMPLTSWLQ